MKRNKINEKMRLVIIWFGKFAGAYGRYRPIEIKDQLVRLAGMEIENLLVQSIITFPLVLSQSSSQLYYIIIY